MGDLAAGATSEDDARVGMAQWRVTRQELPRCAGMMVKVRRFKRKLTGKMSEMWKKVHVKLV